ncbi:pyridoxamine 5'-phosphate oxidase family protein [Microlunatus capsulatus]|uniref:pyridoxamine 5'-phosphate oxidase family protein n=1 Tax=Microlunatus capsulatus TaxID=99117 RepID=UPI001AE633B7|nr:pyridoxamine 5'-phosphate oxidase family protein [Microlunatus capsulatus]
MPALGRNPGADATAPEHGLPEDRCLALLRRHSIGRVLSATTDGLAVVPVNYRFDGDRLVLSAPPGLEELAAASGPVTFEVDQHEEGLPWSWVVVVQGTLRVLDADDVDASHFDPPLAAWSADGGSPYLELVARSWTGRELSRHHQLIPGADGC